MKKIKFRIGQTKSEQPTPSKELLAAQAKRAMDYLAPLIRADHMSPEQAMVLVALQTNANITGNPDQSMTEVQIKKLITLILFAWKMKYFTPCKMYPHTWDETLDALAIDGVDVEDGAVE